MTLFKNFVFSEPVPAYDKVWIIGDDFMARTFSQYFQHAFLEAEVDPGYIRIHYDTSGYCSAKLTHNMISRNVLSYIRNGFVQAINAQILLPKYVIVVMEEDMIRAMNHYEKGARALYLKCIKWIMKEFHRVTTAYKEKLPTKSRKFKYPQILWVPTMTHLELKPINEYITMWNDCLETTAQGYKEMHILKLHTWDPEDRTTYSEEGEMNASGFAKYWVAVNDAFQAWDKEQMKSQMLNAIKKPVAATQSRKEDHGPVDGKLTKKTEKRYNHYDRYHWSSQKSSGGNHHEYEHRKNSNQEEKQDKFGRKYDHSFEDRRSHDYYDTNRRNSWDSHATQNKHRRDW